MFSTRTILVLSPHTDDGEIAAGGSIAKFIEKGIDVYYVAFSTCEKSVPEGFPDDVLIYEVREATKVLGIPESNVILFDYMVREFPLNRQRILDDIINLNERIRPQLVLIPSSNDMHQDHQTIHKESLRAFKKTSTILGYEHPWNNLTFTTDVFVKLKREHVLKKIKALSKYKSQVSRTYYDKRYIEALARTRGAQIETLYAETFELLRWIL